MSGFLFSRRASADSPSPAPTAPPPTDQLLSDSGQAQAITAAAIFAALVSKGIVSAEEAAQLMGEIGMAIEQEVGGALAASANRTLDQYGQALLSADK